MVEPKSKADQDKMGIAFKKLAEEDPTFRVETNLETGETVISGMVIHLMYWPYASKVEANVGAPRYLTVKHSRFYSSTWILQTSVWW